MKTIYFIRHSKALKFDNKDNFNNIFNTDNSIMNNQKNVLSIEGEELARDKMNNPELKNLDYVVASNFVRAISTAKYLANYNNLPITIIPGFGERVIGTPIDNMEFSEYEHRQFYEPTFKTVDGECQEEVLKRYKDAFDKVFELDGDRIAIVSHATALSFFIKSLTKADYVDNRIIIEFNNKIVFDEEFYNCIIFKMIFDDNKELIDISVVE